LFVLLAWECWIFLQAMRRFLKKQKTEAATVALGLSAIFGIGAIYSLYVARILL